MEMCIKDETEQGNKIKQLVISGLLGDGHLTAHGSMVYSCKYRDYMEYKNQLLGDNKREVKEAMNSGFKRTHIYTLTTPVLNYVRSITRREEGEYKLSVPLEELIQDLDELGLALWIYDDGSLHKDNLFYNLNTHAYPKEFQEKYLIPLLNKFDIYPEVLEENKEDGRKFHYLYIGKYNGADKVNELLKKYPVESYKYKTFTYPEWWKYEKIRERFRGYKISLALLGYVMRPATEENYLDRLFVNDLGYVVGKEEQRHGHKPKKIMIIK